MAHHTLCPCPVLPTTQISFQNPILRSPYTISAPSTARPTEFSAAPAASPAVDIDDFMERLPVVYRPLAQRVHPQAFVNHLLPAGLIQPGARFVAACFLLFLCVIFAQSDGEGDAFDWTYLINALQSLRNQPWTDILPQDNRSQVIVLFSQLVRASQLDLGASDFVSTRMEPWKSTFYHEMMLAMQIVRHEKRQKPREGPLKEWAELRLLRLTVRPFMVLARASLDLDTDLSHNGSGANGLWTHLLMLQSKIQLTVNLQTDVVGWVKDFADRNGENVIELRIKDGSDPKKAFEFFLDWHNTLVAQLFQDHLRCQTEQLAWLRRVQNPSQLRRREFQNINIYTGIAIGLGRTVVEYAQVCGLYREDFANVSFPETITRAKYKALEEDEEFDELMGLPDAVEE